MRIGEHPTTAHTRVPVRMARTSSTSGSSGERRVRGHPAALGEPVEHERGVGDRDAGQVLLARLEVGHDARQHARVGRAVAARQSGHRPRGAAERLRAGEHPLGREAGGLVVAVGQRRERERPARPG